MGTAPRHRATGAGGRPGASARRPRPARSTVSTTRSPSTRLSVSATGSTGMAAPWAAAADHGLDERRRDQRPRPVVDEHHPIAPAGRPGRECRTPAATESWRARRRRRPRDPPAASRPRRPPRRAPARRPPPSARRAEAAIARHGPREERAPADGRGRACRCPPMRRDEPAATTTASAPATSARRRQCASRPRASVSRDAAGRRPSARRRSGARGSRLTSTSRSISRAPPSTTIIVPSSRKPTPWPASLPSWITWTRSSSPGRTAGLTASRAS